MSNSSRKENPDSITYQQARDILHTESSAANMRIHRLLVQSIRTQLRGKPVLSSERRRVMRLRLYQKIAERISPEDILST